MLKPMQLWEKVNGGLNKTIALFSIHNCFLGGFFNTYLPYSSIFALALQYNYASLVLGVCYCTFANLHVSKICSCLRSKAMQSEARNALSSNHLCFGAFIDTHFNAWKNLYVTTKIVGSSPTSRKESRWAKFSDQTVWRALETQLFDARTSHAILTHFKESEYVECNNCEKHSTA